MSSSYHDNHSSSHSLAQNVSACTESTAVEGNDADRIPHVSVKHATIVDIDSSNPIRLAVKRPSINDLTCLGPRQIMQSTSANRTDLRWVHLPANCMSWVEDLMAAVCREKGLTVPRDTDGTDRNPLLRKDLWSHLFHGKASKKIHARFMGPVCTPFSLSVDDEESGSDGASTHGTLGNLVLYMPFLHWESLDAWSERQQLIREIREGRPGRPQVDRGFVTTYLPHKTAPLHDRRSLHQAFYHFSGLTRSVPRVDQVMEKFTAGRGGQDEGAKLIVVDQLWLWLIKGTRPTNEQDGDGNGSSTDPDLVITAFPDRFNDRYDSANVHRCIVEHLERGLQPPLKKAEDLVALIVEHCTGVFFQRQLENDKWFLEFFAAAIGEVRESQRAAFSDFCAASRSLDNCQSQHSISSALSDPSLSITEETSLVCRIKAIIDELTCIDYILSRQEGVLHSLTRAQPKSRMLRTVAEMVKERRVAWASIASTAEASHSEIQSQMDLKQKQANLSESRMSRFQAQASASHSRIMLLFTVVTIIFLPLSFLATWFGMNIEDPKAGSLKLYQIAAIIFPISMVLVMVALAFAFNERLRGVVVRVVESGWTVLSGSRPTDEDERFHRNHHDDNMEMV
ncbi:hypothetical protein H2200_010050 [Cladophialophora chaetospira]|uniref:Uncharacterized protein n=1 Tax=Cladophialophora chaetospira TaxID=386627 RepID=A0AA39CEJ4_9EURO|nr:hypothetical protein H2200_010050 [Cladophialophora chaetospira]